MMSIFSNMSNLIEADFSNFGFSTVTTLASMFEGCDKLEKVIFSSDIDTAKLQNMNWMFYGCQSLNSLDLRNFDTSRVIQMKEMFYDCISLTSLNLSNFNTVGVNFFDGMFQECVNLKYLDVSSFVTS